MNEGTSLSDLLSLNLHECEEEVKNVVDKAVKEMSMEKILRELDNTWSRMEFEREVHSRTNHVLLRASEELIETLEENQVKSKSFRNQLLRRPFHFVFQFILLFSIRFNCKI